MADSAIGVTPAAIGVWPSSKNLVLGAPLLKLVINLSADGLLERGVPRWFIGGERGGLSTSGMLVWAILLCSKLSCMADGDAQGSEDSWSVQAKLKEKKKKKKGKLAHQVLTGWTDIHGQSVHKLTI
jgi:hypothetical protein